MKKAWYFIMVTGIFLILLHFQNLERDYIPVNPTTTESGVEQPEATAFLYRGLNQNRLCINFS